MASREEDSQIGQTSQLSENRGGLKSFSDKNTPSDLAKGSQIGSLHDSDFGTLGQSRRQQTQRAELNQQIAVNKKGERAARIGYRNAIKKGNGMLAMNILNRAQSSGLTPFGIKVEGQTANAASSQIEGRQASMIKAGAMQFQPDQNFFHGRLNPSKFNNEPVVQEEPVDDPIISPEGSDKRRGELSELLYDVKGIMDPEKDDEPFNLDRDLTKDERLGFRQRLGGLHDLASDKSVSGTMDNIFSRLGIDPAQGREVMQGLSEQNSLIARGVSPNLSSFK